MKKTIKKSFLILMVISIIVSGFNPLFSLTGNVRADEGIVISNELEASVENKDDDIVGDVVDSGENENLDYGEKEIVDGGEDGVFDTGEKEIVDAEENEDLDSEEVVLDGEAEDETSDAKDEISSIGFNLNNKLSVLHIIVDGEDHIFFQEQAKDTAVIIEDNEVIDTVNKKNNDLFVLDEPWTKEKVIVEAYDVWGYPIDIHGYNTDGTEIELTQYTENERFSVIPLDGSVSKVVAGTDTSGFSGLPENVKALLRSGKLVSGVIHASKSMITSGNDMNASNNAVLAFAKSIGFDVDQYLASPNAWKVVNSDPDGLYDTNAGKAIIENGLTYGIGTIQNAVGNSALVNKGDIWKAMKDQVNVYSTVNTWSDYARYAMNNSYETEIIGGQYLSPGSVECAGLVNTFFGYIHENLWDDEDWRMYYQAYNYGIMNSSFGYNTDAIGYNLNNVITVNSGVQGLLNYTAGNTEDYYVKTASTKLSHDEWIEALDKMAPGSVVLFKPDLSSALIQHAGIYVGKANGLHWMFHTNNTGYRARIIPMEYYSLNFNTGEGDEHKGTYIYRAGGRIFEQDGELSVIKKSSSKDITNNNSRYTLKGIKFNIYTNATGTNNNLKPDPSSMLDIQLEISSYDTKTSVGKSESIVLPEGTYYVQEDKSSISGKGFRLNEKVYKVEVRADEKTEVEIENDPVISPINLILIKKAFRNGKELNTSDIPAIEDARFELSYYDGIFSKAADAEASGSPHRKWIMKTKYNGSEKRGEIKLENSYFVSGSSFYKLNEKNGFPIGTLLVKEVKEPKGYVLNSIPYLMVFKYNELENKGSWSIYNGNTGALISNSNNIDVSKTTDADLSVANNVISGDLNFYKVDIDGKKMSNIPFLIERLDDKGNPVESHVVVTDDNGSVDTSKLPKTGSKVNSLDQYVENGRFTDDSKLDPTVGIWFGEDQTTRKAGTGSLIYSQYRIRELMCEVNKGQTMLAAKVFKDDLSDFTDGVNKSLENIFIDLIIHPESRLTDANTKTKIVQLKGEGSVVDAFRWDHLKVGEKYRLKTVITYEDRDGNHIEKGENTIEFVPEKVDSTNTSYGTEYNSVTIDTSDMNGGVIHATDYLSLVRGSEEILLAIHNEDMDIASQMAFVPYMGTFASDSKTGDNVGTIEKQAEIIDKIEFENLPDKGMYIIKGKLVDKDSKEMISEVSQLVRVNESLEENVLKPDGTLVIPSTGTLNMPPFKFDASGMGGRTLVVTETVIDYDTEEIFLSHDDMEDENQTIHYLKLETEATDESTKQRTGVVGKTRIIDRVTLTNVVKGMEYLIKGDLVYKEDCTDSNGIFHKKGEVISSHEGLSIVADCETGGSMTVDLEYHVDASALDGISGVVFEDAWHNDIKIASHHDYEAKSQTPNWPRVRTKAWDAETKDKLGYVKDGVAVLVDTVSLSNLTIGEKYRVIGTLYKLDGKPFLINDKEYSVSSDVFEAKKENIEMDITFKCDNGEFLDNTIVVYEKLMHIGEDVNESGEPTINETEVARHEDPNDLNQTVKYEKEREPKIETVAYDKFDGDKVIKAQGKQIIVDRVMYSDLKPNETYRQILSVYDKETREPIRTKYLKMPVKATKWFRPKEEDGFIEIEVEIDSELVEGKTLVMFEETTLKGKAVATHFDFESTSQTVTVDEKPRMPDKRKDEVVKTGDDEKYGVYIIIMITGLLSLIIMARKEIKNVHL